MIWFDLAMEGRWMASVSQGRTRRQGNFVSGTRPRAFSKPKRRWPKRLVIGLTLLMVLVLLLPTIISKTPLRDAPLRLALRNMHGTVQAGGASLSWFAPLEYSDIQIRNEQGDLLVSLAKVQSERSLYGLLSNLNDLGTFRVERPQVNVALRPDGSNLEDLFAKEKNPFAKPEAPAESTSSPHLPLVTAEIIDGSANVLDTSSGRKWSINKFNLHVKTAPDTMLPAELMASAEVPVDGHTAQLAVTSVPNPAGGWDHIDAKIDSLPLAMFRGLADRIAPGLQLTGTLSTNLRLDGIGGLLTGQNSSGPASAAPASGPSIQISGTIGLDTFGATGGPLGTDQLMLAKVQMPCKVAIRGRQIDIDQLGVTSEVGQLNVSGSIALAEQDKAAATGGVATAQSAVAPSALNVEGQIDIAKLAAQLPTTLRVRSGTQITSGQLRLSLASKTDSAGQSWSGQLSASDLAANYEGRRVAWDQPINLQWAVHGQAGNYSVDALNCSSSFLNVSGRGSLDQFQVEARCDLDRMMSELSQFVDLGNLKLGGKGDAQIHWSHGVNGEFQTGADVQLQGLQIALPGKPVWQEDSVSVSARAAGSIDNLTLATLSAANVRRLDAAQFTAAVDNKTAGTHDQIDAKLLQAEDKLAAGKRWPLEIQMQGQLGRWWPRVAPWLGIQGLDLSGACSLSATAAYSDSGLEIQQVKATCNNLHTWGWNELFIDEPVAQMEAAGSYDFKRNQITLSHTALLTSSASVQTDAMTIAMPTGGVVSMQGNLAYQADLARLWRWVNDPRSQAKYSLAGRLIGSVDVAREGAMINGKLDAGVDNFAIYVLAEADNPSRNGLRDNLAQQLVWQENRLTVAGAVGMDRAADSVQLTSLDVGSQALVLHAAGKIADLSTQQNVDLTGKIDYDWTTLGALLKPYLGNRVQIAGRQSRDFAVRGPLNANDKVTVAAGGAVDQFAFLGRLIADGSLGWNQARLYGMSVGNIDLIAHLENGTVGFKPIETVLSGQHGSGQLSITPTVHLSPGPPEMVLGKGTVLSNVQISDEVSDGWLKFVAPMVAGATRAEGQFSLELDGARVPLLDPKKADAGGRLIVQNMTVTPGPLFRSFAVIGQQVEALVKGRLPTAGMNGDTALLRIDDQKVDFHLVDGRVYHQGLSMQVGQVTMRTRGWVGLDESVNIIVEIPIKDEWTRQRNSPLASLDEPMIRIPIVGNLKDPKFDNRVMAKLLEAVPRAAIQGQINKTLDLLLPQR
jgi:translocation and assembly module TamB